MLFTLEEMPWSRHPWALTEVDQTDLTNRMEEHGTSARHATRELEFVRETAHKALKEEGYCPYWIFMLEELVPADFPNIWITVTD